MVGIYPCFSVMNNTGWYITGFCLSWTILVGTSPSFFCRDQYWLVNQPFFLLWTILVCISTGGFVSWTIMVDISNGFVCHEQYWLVYPLVVSVMDIIDSLISQICLS